MKTPIMLKAWLYTLLMVSIVGAAWYHPTHVLGDTNQEWAAVQKVVGSDINPQAFLYPVMNAIGTQALQDGAILGIPADQFLSYQEHPARMMAAVQVMIRRYDVGAYGLTTVESLNQQVDIFNTTGLAGLWPFMSGYAAGNCASLPAFMHVALKYRHAKNAGTRLRAPVWPNQPYCTDWPKSSLDPVEQATLIERLRTQPLATSYITPSQPTHPLNAPAQPVLHPPVAVSFFQLPVSIVGKSSHSLREGSVCGAPCPPLSRYERGINGTPNAFVYEVAPPLPSKAFVNGIYMVTIYKTVDSARAANLAARDKGIPLWLLDMNAAPLPIAQPVADNEWLRGYQKQGGPQDGPADCYAAAGVRYNNILMLAQVDNYNSITPPSYVTCQTSYKWSTRVLAALYTRAQNYARHH